MKIVFDIGATHTRLALTDGTNFLERARFNTDSTRHGVESLNEELVSFVGSEKITAAAGGLPGSLDSTTGRLLHAPNLPGWIGLRIGRQISQTIGVPVVVHNDTAVVGLGEAIYGAGRGITNVAYITVSTGINGAHIMNGQIDEGVHGIELGAELIEGSDHKLHALEELAGGASLAHRYGRLPADLNRPKLWHQEAKYLAQAVYNLILTWSPGVIIFGGSMMRDINIVEIGHIMRQWPPVYRTWPPLRKAELGDDGGLYGGLALLASTS